MPNHKNSQSKIESCGRKLQKAIDLIAFEMKQTPTLESVHIVLIGYLPRLEPGVAEKANLDEVFDAAEIMAMKAKIAEIKTVARRAKQESDLAHSYERASAQLARWSASMDAELAASLNERMAAVAMDCTEPKEVTDLQPLFHLCKEVFQVTNDVQNAKIEGPVRKSWTVTKDSQPAKFAVPFAETPAALKVAAWLVNKPAANADHREFKVWRDAGYELLKGELDHPWGMCSCGKEKLMPWQKAGETTWRMPSPLGYECRKAKRGGNTTHTSSGIGKKNGKSVVQTAAPISAGMDMTDWKAEDIHAFREQTEEKRAQEKHELKRSQRARKLAERRLREQEQGQ